MTGSSLNTRAEAIYFCTRGTVEVRIDDVDKLKLIAKTHWDDIVPYQCHRSELELQLGRSDIEFEDFSKSGPELVG